MVIMPRPLNINSNVQRQRADLYFKDFALAHFSALCSCFKAEHAVLTAMTDI